jgi:uncharacterized damage-inducible protein DinB
MQETVDQYIQRILGHTAGKEPLEVQAATPKKLEEMIEGLSDEELREQPGPGKWSVLEIVAHLADAELVGSWRIRAILAASGSPLQAYDQNAWVAALHYRERDARQCLEQFRVLREANLALFKLLTPEQWQAYGMHSERGKETVEHIVRMFAGHDLNHLQQIERIVAAKAA